MGRTRQEDVRIEQRRQQVGEFYVKGSTQSQMARELGVSQSTVSADLKAIRGEWRDSRIRDFDEAVAVELKKIDHLEREAWSGWERSQQPAESTKVTQDGSGKKAEKIVKQQQGDPRYLEQVHRCIAARRTLLGLDAPTRIAPTSPDGRESYHAHVMAELMRLAEETAEGPTVIDAAYVEEEVKRHLQIVNAEATVSGEGKGRHENTQRNESEW
jgi:predicted transcriptional regulator